MKLTLNDVTNIDALSVINDNFDKIEQELQNKVLYRDNPVLEPNTLETPIDMNGNDILNVGDVFSINGRWATIDEVEDIQDNVEILAAQVAIDASLSEGYRDAAEAALASTQTVYDNFDDRYLGVKSVEPTLDNDGNTLVSGALYFRSSGTPIMRVYNGTTWQDVGSITMTTTNTIDSSLYANQTEAEQGSNNTKVMTPLRVKNAIDFLGSGIGGGTDRVFIQNDQTISTSYSLSATKNFLSAGPLTISNGATVTVPNGATWSII